MKLTDAEVAAEIDRVFTKARRGEFDPIPGAKSADVIKANAIAMQMELDAALRERPYDPTEKFDGNAYAKAAREDMKFNR
ncbi:MULTISPECIES: hypothetical protein [unclassified Mesorhizobium]|uniref:hypothetical protein n=1 Tax=unclassified Mesorhizobium TaxID=325217 RepID=UPI000FCB5BF1|nr:MULTISPECIES: hypothetical protein [unclassified Mesorhizobium]RUX97435.1 hypothetical protein EN993_03800 [Mesorhizobium sp. M7D.F.Ca.US.004.01.2.1]RVA36621.1 hypothetical protein EN935_01610 [Mesorhizobium sp. M7D.F.Ca.US.004.03.1.1]